MQLRYKECMHLKLLMTTNAFMTVDVQPREINKIRMIKHLLIRFYFSRLGYIDGIVEM